MTKDKKIDIQIPNSPFRMGAVPAPEGKNFADLPLEQRRQALRKQENNWRSIGNNAHQSMKF